MSPLDIVSVLLSLAVAAISVASTDVDWMWLAVSAIGIVLVLYPKKYLGGRGYNGFLLVASMVPMAAQAALGGYMCFEWTYDLWVVSLVLQSWTCVVYGYMLALLIDASTEIVLSKRWILLFSLLFALSISAMYLFIQFASMYFQGEPVFNTDFQGAGMDDTRIWMNSQLMTPPTVAVPVTIIVALAMRFWTQRTEKSELLKGGA
ncbi:MAG: hypothetical protein VB016_01860 [Methanomassiliicoccaceae archaeon]|nr:hypothetical protein [Methanomassiliicoccaceae archaeon]